MPQKRTLSLMRDSSTQEEILFVADLYSGNRIEDSVYLDRKAMLEWLHPIDPQASFVAAHALDQLMHRPPRTIIDIALESRQRLELSH